MKYIAVCKCGRVWYLKENEETCPDCGSEQLEVSEDEESSTDYDLGVREVRERSKATNREYT